MMEPPLPTMVVPLWLPISIATALSPSAETSSVCPFRLIVRLSAPTTMQGFGSLAVAIRSFCRTRFALMVPEHCCARPAEGHASPTATPSHSHTFCTPPAARTDLPSINSLLFFRQSCKGSLILGPHATVHESDVVGLPEAGAALQDS